MTSILKGIGFENFRIFKQETLLDFAPLTVLTGTNSSGKSTVINGLKLIGESFKGVDPYDSELGDLFNCEFNTGDMFRRYGNLGKFISFQDAEGETKNSFNFSIPVHLNNIDEEAYIEYIITLKDNDLNTGLLTDINLKLLHSHKTIFSINGIHKNTGSPMAPNSFTTKIDLVFFFEKFLQFEQEQATFYYQFYKVIIAKENYKEGKLDALDLDDIKQMETDASVLFDVEYENFKQKYNVRHSYWNFIEEKDLVFNILALNRVLQDGNFYDFSVLWKENARDEVLFQHSVKRFYSISDKEVFHSITRDIIQLLSNNEWRDNYSFKLNFENSGELYSAFSSVAFAKRLRDKNVKYNAAGDEILNTEYESLNYDKIEKLKNKKDLLEYLITVMNNKNQGRGMYFETLFFKDFVTPNVALVNNVLIPFKLMESVSSERANTKGVKSVLDSDDFSRLMKKYFSASTDFEKESYNQWRIFLKKWLNEFKIADDIQFDKEKDYDVFKVRIIKNGSEMMLSDEGFGVSQVLPVILSCCPVIADLFGEMGNQYRGNESKLVLIEEPETNLHPALQSKLADMFMDAIKTFNIRFVIETHSEYLVRKLQYLTGKGDINPEDTVIYYFYPPTEVPEGEKQVKKINIQKDGSLTDDFGTGFFDEASNWKFELLALKNYQKN